MLSIDRSRRGSALILSVSMLAVLALISIAFARLMQVERSSSQNFRLTVQANNNAQSGMEHAIAFLTDPDNMSPGVSVADVAGDGRWIFRNDAGTDVGIGTVGLAESLNPSLEAPAALGTPINSGELATAALPGFRAMRNFYKLRVTDVSSQININSPADGFGGAVPCQVEILLRNLGEAIQSIHGASPPVWWPSGVPVPNPFTNAVVSQIVTFRLTLPDGLFNEEEQMRPLVEAGVAMQAQKDNIWRLVRDYITTWGWRDPRTVDMQDPNVGFYHASGTGWLRNPVRWPRKDATIDEVLPIFQSRFPVNLNTAPKAVLVACLRGVSGRARKVAALGGGQAGNASTVGLFSFAHTRYDLVAGLTTATAGTLADQIITRRNTAAFTSMDDFASFLASSSLSADQQLILLANADPNWKNNQFLGESHRSSAISRLFLYLPTTEFCFIPPGFFEVESLGWVQDELGRTVAESQIEAVVLLWDVIRRSTQRDFLQELQSASDTITGPEPLANIETSAITSSDPRLPLLYGGATEVALNGNPYEGFIQVLSEGIDVTRSGGGLSITTTPDLDGGEQTFYHPFWRSWAPQFEKAPAGRQGFQGHGAGTDHWKKTGDTIFRGESLAPDGALFFNYNDEEISFDSTYDNNDENFPPDKGTVEFWVKFEQTGAIGSHETLAYITTPIGTYTLQAASGSPPLATALVGVTWKLERYGSKLRSTRFLWMNWTVSPAPTYIPLVPSGSPFGSLDFLWSEVEINMQSLGWGDNEWHHIAHSWKELTQQWFFADGNLVGWVEKGNPPNTGGTAFYVPYTLDASNSNYVVRFELVSIEPLPRAVFGGHIYTGNGTAVFRGQSDSGSTVRLSNAKIDEIQGYKFNIKNTSGGHYDRACNKSRFARNSGRPNPFHEGELTFDRPGRIGLVRSRRHLPASGGGTVQFSATVNAATDSDTGELLDLGGVAVAEGDTMTYRWEFLLGGGVNKSPVIDDLTVYQMVTPTFVSYRHVFTR